MKQKGLTFAERALRREQLREVAKAARQPDPFLDTVSEVTCLGIGTAVVGMVVIGNLLGQ